MLRTTAHFEWDFTYVLMSAQPTNQSISRGLVKASVIPYRNTGDASAEHRLHLCGQSAPDNHFAAEETGSSASAIISAPLHFAQIQAETPFVLSVFPISFGNSKDAAGN